ncbi:MAG: hypothetical protein Q7V05_07095 [Methanoregula sp.]|nr:hypothetical protein [Methanoregula sp.]
MSFEAFVDDDRTLSAVLYKFAVMGEATKHLPTYTCRVSGYSLEEHCRL